MKLFLRCSECQLFCRSWYKIRRCAFRLRAALEMEGLAPERIQELLEVLGRAEDES